MTNNSLPIGFEKLKTEKPYVKISKLSDGEHKFRIVSRPIAGWIDWLDNKPYRYRPDAKPGHSFDPSKKIKSFWVLHVWDYTQEGLYVMEITQIGVIKALENYALNEDWGDLTSFDFKIKKEGSGMDTEYTVIPVPHKPISDKIKKAIASTKIRLEALYEGKDPWTDLEETASVATPKREELTKEQVGILDEYLEKIDDMDYLDELCEFLKVDALQAMNPTDFDRTIRSMKAKIKEQSNESNVA
jgi:hypothetical protein